MNFSIYHKPFVCFVLMSTVVSLMMHSLFAKYHWKLFPVLFLLTFLPDKAINSDFEKKKPFSSNDTKAFWGMCL